MNRENNLNEDSVAASLFNIIHAASRAKICVVFCITLLALVASTTHAETLEAAVDRQQLSENETLTLRIRLSGTSRPTGEPNLGSLQQNFDIISSNPSSQYRNINGRIEQYTDWTLTLAPKSVGKLLIPPITYEKLSTRPITIEVKKETHIAGHARPVMLETQVSDSQAYVQQQIILTYRLLYSTHASNLNMEQMAIDGVQIQELPRSDYKKTIGHTTYDVAEFNFALIPEASGTYTIPSFLWSLNTSDQPARRFGFSANRMKLHRLRTDEIALTVKPRPGAYPTNATWLPARALTIKEQWQDSIDNFRVGEPITRKIVIEADGLSGEQLPQIVTSRGNADFKFYEDQPTINSSTRPQGIAGQRIENIAVVANREGSLTLPKIEITWWDTNSDEIKVATLPEQTIQVKPADINTGSNNNEAKREISASVLPENLEAHEQNHSASSAPPQWWGLALLGLILSNATLAILWFAQKKTIRTMKQNNPSQGQTENLSEKQAYKRLRYTAENGEPEQIREALLDWMRQRWPHQRNNTLDQLIARVSDERLTKALKTLDDQLFGMQTSDTYDASEIMIALDAWRGPSAKAEKEAAVPVLKPLYG